MEEAAYSGQSNAFRLFISPINPTADRESVADAIHVAVHVPGRTHRRCSCWDSRHIVAFVAAECELQLSTWIASAVGKGRRSGSSIASTGIAVVPVLKLGLVGRIFTEFGNTSRLQGSLVTTVYESVTKIDEGLRHLDCCRLRLTSILLAS